MNKRQLQKIKSVLTKSIESHLKKGGKLIADDFYLGGGRDNLANDKLIAACKCPVQIVTDNLAELDKGQRPSTASELSRALGFTISRDEMYAIINGYDKRTNADWGTWMLISKEAYKTLYAIGYELRKKYKPLTKTQINKIMGFKYV